MRGANLPKHLCGRLILICVICLFPVFTLAANGPSSANLVGTWNYNSLISGPSAPWWERGTLTVKPDGTFTGSGKDSNGNPDSINGAFSISSGGIFMTGGGCSDTLLCQIDSGDAVLVCTHISGDGSSNLTIFTKQAASYSPADLVGDWEAVFLSSGPTPWWAKMSDTTYPDGTYKGTLTPSEGPSTAASGQISISPTGAITCVSGDCLSGSSSYAAFMGAGKTVSVGTSGAALGQDAQLSVFTRQAVSYSPADLAGTWHGNSLASGPGAPWWERDTVTIDADGTFTVSWTGSDGSSGAGTGTFSISSTGVITCVSGDCADRTCMSFMDAGKTVATGTRAWPDGATREIKIYTKAPVPGAPEGVTAAAGDACATVSFNAPVSTGGSPIQAYLVTSHPGGKTAIGLSSPITVSGLTNGAAYTFRVAATNAKGTGPLSAPSNAATPATTGTGSLKVTINPAAAVKAGAKWNVDGGTWQKSGATVGKLPVGAHTVNFNKITGWTSPASQPVNIVNGQTASVGGIYEERAGSLQITISPPAAVTAGAEWKVDSGGWQNSGAVVEGLSVGSHKITFKTVSGWNSPTVKSVNILDGQTTTDDVSYVRQTGSLKVTITPAAAVSAGAMWNVDEGSWQTSGTTLSGITVGSHVVYFAAIVGWPAPAPVPVTISNGKTTSATGTYKLKSGGSLTVTITPAGAVAAGAQWNVDGGAWQNSGDTVDNLSKGSHAVDFNTIAGWTSPDAQTVTISSGKTTTATGVYVQQFGSLTVTISPAAAVSAGAMWNVDGGAWQNSGATVGKLPVGAHTVNFNTITGWTSPASQSVNIVNGQTTSATGTYVAATLSFTPGSSQCVYAYGGCGQGTINEMCYSISGTGTACGAVGAVLVITYGGSVWGPGSTTSCGQWDHVGVAGSDWCKRGPTEPACTTVGFTGGGVCGDSQCDTFTPNVYAYVEETINGSFITTGNVPFSMSCPGN